MISGATWHYWFPAYDANYRRYSPGRILLLEMIRSAAEFGVRYIDLGAGGEPYKEHVGNDAAKIASGSMELPSLVAAGRFLYRACSALVPRALRTRLPVQKVKRMFPGLR